jgi:hypothetical protein
MCYVKFLGNMVHLRVHVFGGVMLCHWVSDSLHFKGTFIFKESEVPPNANVVTKHHVPKDQTPQQHPCGCSTVTSCILVLKV